MPYTFIIVIKKLIPPLQPLVPVPHLVLLSLDLGTIITVNSAAIASTSSILTAYTFRTVIGACSSSTIASSQTSNTATSSLFSFFLATSVLPHLIVELPYCCCAFDLLVHLYISTALIS